MAVSFQVGVPISYGGTLGAGSEAGGGLAVGIASGDRRLQLEVQYIIGNFGPNVANLTRSAGALPLRGQFNFLPGSETATYISPYVAAAVMPMFTNIGTRFAATAEAGVEIGSGKPAHIGSGELENFYFRLGAIATDALNPSSLSLGGTALVGLRF